jgi:hypothetical protein
MSLTEDLLAALCKFVNTMKKKLTSAIEEVTEDALDILIDSLYESFDLKELLSEEWEHIKNELKVRFLSSLAKFNRYISANKFTEELLRSDIRTIMIKGGLPRQMLKNAFTIKRVLEGNLRDYSV